MEKNIKYKNGFLLGKFLPVHFGHLHLIETAVSMCEHLTVMVCSLEAEPIPGTFRYEWVRELMSKHTNVSVVHVTDENPQEPSEHPDFWNIWVTTIRKNVVGKIDAVFSSETYGEELAKQLEAEHFMVDLKRKTFPVSGTKIRENPYKFWNFIPNIVRPYYTKRVALLGPESVGKTVLAEKLAKHYNTEWVPEYGREYTKEFNLTLDGICTIANKQLELEEQAVKKANKVLICDTEIITTKIWSLIYFRKVPKMVEDINALMDYDLYLLYDTDVPWINDGTRMVGNIRNWHFETIKSELSRLGKNYQVIDGNYNKRLISSIKEIDLLMKPKIDFQYPLW